MIQYFSAATGFSKKAILFIFAAGFITHLICAWYSLGFFHYDEHYQILEFANFKAGLSSANDLAWEHKAQIRPTLQPWIAYFAIKAHAFFRPHDAFTVAGILRVLTAILGFVTSLLISAAAFKWLKDNILRKTVLLLSVFLWFVVFMDARFSSESWAGIFFFSALALLVLKDSFTAGERKQNIFFVVFCGFLIGLSLVFRLQMILLLPGLGLWCLFVARTPFKVLAWLIAGGLFALAIGFISDYLFYGNWVNTAYRYFQINIMEGKAAEFGVSPWWFYVPEFLRKAHLPSSFIVFILVMIAWLRYPKHILTFTCVPFVLLHMAIAHKELRFLFPIAHAMPVFLALGVQFLLSVNRKYALKSAGGIIAFGLLTILAMQNFILLAQVSTSPVNGILKPLSHIYRQEKGKDVNVIIADPYEYGLVKGLPMNFYITPNMYIYKQAFADSIKYILQETRQPAYFIVRSRGLQLPDKYTSLKNNIESTHFALPRWYSYININNWMGRTSSWRIYKLRNE